MFCKKLFSVISLALFVFISNTASADIIVGPIVNPANNHSYYLLSNQNWTDSESEAVQLGGHLVTINDAEENAWILATFSNYGGILRSLWIGFNDVDIEGQWVWTSGQPVTYTNFSPGSPDNVNNEDFAYMIPPGGMWNDGQNGLWGTYNLYGVVELIGVIDEAVVDIKPGSCPNPLNVKSNSVLPVAILGSSVLDVTTIDAGSIFLNGAQNVRSAYEDVAGFIADANDCECTTLGPDGHTDLTLKFMTQDIVAAFGEVNHDDVLELQLNCVLYDETPVVGADCIVIRGKHKPINKADINKDGVVNMADIVMLAGNWLQSSIVED